jgi:pyridoxal/pyridoxine/pyridoxamine kinase
VMGDEGRLYVKPEMVEAFRSVILPLASVILPNGFEAQLLCGREGAIQSPKEGFEACAELHAKGPHTVVRREGEREAPLSRGERTSVPPCYVFGIRDLRVSPPLK